jgi:hypothetical protein
MSKAKSPLPTFPEIQFESSLPLEEAVRLLIGIQPDRSGMARDAGNLLQVIINAFKAAGDVAQDGGELDASDDSGVNRALYQIEYEKLEKFATQEREALQKQQRK